MMEGGGDVIAAVAPSTSVPSSPQVNNNLPTVQTPTSSSPSRLSPRDASGPSSRPQSPDEEAVRRIRLLEETARTLQTERTRLGVDSLLVLEACALRAVAAVLWLRSRESTGYAPRLDLWLETVGIAAADSRALQTALTGVAALSELDDGALLALADRLHLATEARRRLRKSTFNLRRYLQSWEELGREPVDLYADRELGWATLDTLPRRSASEAAAGSEAPESPAVLSTATSSQLQLGLGSETDATPRSASGLAPRTPWAYSSSESMGGSSGGAGAARRGGGPTAADSSSSSLSLLLHQPAAPSRPPLLAESTRGASSSRESLSVPSACASSSTRAATLSPPSPLRLLSNVTPAAPPSTPRHPPLESPLFGGPPGMPRSPRGAGPAAGRVLHAIPHVWKTKRIPFKLTDNQCFVCRRPLSFLNPCEKCKSCKIQVHPMCKSKMTDSACGLTKDHLKAVLTEMFIQNAGECSSSASSSGSALPGSRSFNEMRGPALVGTPPTFQYPPNVYAEVVLDSSSSTNSSAPSTPAIFGMTPTSYASSRSAATGSSGTTSAFAESSRLHPVVESRCSDASVQTAVPPTSSLLDEHAITLEPPPPPLHSSTGSQLTLIVDSTGSQGTEHTLTELSQGAGSSHTDDGEGEDGQPAGAGGGRLQRGAWHMFTVRGPGSAAAAAAWTEVTIPFASIQMKSDRSGKPSLIGHGRFGKVYHGNYYGDVAVKILSMDHAPVDEQHRLEAFKRELEPYKITRHDNLVLFLGACLEAPNWALVMNFCKGTPLYRMLHVEGERLDYDKLLHFATQICQGVSYLHTRRILHRDLRSSNVFVEAKGKVVITDFALLSAARLHCPERESTMWLPKEWLSYAAPELLRSLGRRDETDGSVLELAFSTASDVYSFGTLWFELWTSSLPFGSHAGEDSTRLESQVVLYRTASGHTPPLPRYGISADAKSLLLQCWSAQPDERPSLPEVASRILRLPRRAQRITARSPSMPTQRAHEAIF